MDDKSKGLRNAAGLAAFLRGDMENFNVVNTPDGIEASERAGQQATVAKEILPRELNFGRGAQEVYQRLGIEVLSEADDLFFNVKLPDGWRKVAEGHAMWSKLVDDQGRERGAIFYKAAFYDRKAHFSVSRRYHFGDRPVGGWDAAEREDGMEAWEGYVTDCGRDIFVTEPTPEFLRADRYEDVNRQMRDAVEDQAKAWIEEHYPQYQDEFAYWD